MTQTDSPLFVNASSSNDSSSSVPDTSLALSQAQTKSFSLATEDVEAIESVRREEGLFSDSAALRLLIAEGRKYRELRKSAERELMARLVEGKTKPGQ
jgi:hypothetical protein